MAKIEFTLRRAVPSDAPLLAEMEMRCFSDPWSEDSLERVLANPAVYYLIAESGGTPVGYAGMTVVADECEIINIAVTESVRRCGIGYDMVQAVLDICRSSGVTSVFLEHRESNTAAAALYEKFGFTPYSVRRKYYRSPTEDAILRRLDL